MQSSTEENHNGNGSCTSNNQPQPCACCAALAQLRMPWMDVAVQHAAPHFPYANPYAYPPPVNPHSFQNNHAQAAFEAPEHDGDEEDNKTVFFKLPSFGKRKESKKKERRAAKNGAAAAPSGSKKAAAPFSSATQENDADAPGGSDTASAEPDGDVPGATEADWQADVPPCKPKFRLNFGLQGIAVSLFGIILPAFVFSSSILSTPKRITLVMLHHPAEAITEFLLVAAMPIVNFLVWSAICKNRANLSRWLVMALGAAIGTGLVLSGICFAALFGNHEELADAIGSDFTTGFTWLAMLSFFSSAVSAYLANRLRLNWELQSTRLKVTIQAITGMVLAFLAFAGSEYRPWCIRLAQFNAVAGDEKIRKEGLNWLRQLYPEREMRMECSDTRAAGLPGLFFPIKPNVQQQLYFTLTGNPYSFRDEKATNVESMPNDYLSRHVVGDKIPHLGLTRSTLSGVLHASTLTSTLNWTFVVKNDNSSPQEMRAELGLPAGAAITGLTVWHRGESTNADFVASGNVESANTTQAGDNTPGMVSDLGHGRVLVHCYPVAAEEELRVNVAMVVPLKSEGDGKASIVTPQLIASNFDLEGEHLIRFRSKTQLSSSAKGLEVGVIPGETTISGVLSQEQLETSPLVVTAAREQISKPYAVLDKLAMTMRREDAWEKELQRVARERQKEQQRQAEAKEDMSKVVLMIDGSRGVNSQVEDFSKLIAQRKKDSRAKVIKPRVITIKPEYVVEKISRIAAPAPTQLIVVVDGSSAMKKYAGELKVALASLPKSIPTKVIVASQENKIITKARPLSEMIPQLEKIDFVGGQDNLKAVVDAAQLAGESKGAAVLWIHGPQSGLNRENYIMSAYESAPAFYELPVVAGTDTFEFFRNHGEIGPFVQVPRSGNSIASDLTEFFGKWNPDNNNYVASISELQKLPDNAVEPGREEARELITLNAVKECEQFISTRHFRRAARIAVRYGFVSPVSSAYLGGTNTQLQDADNNVAAPLQSNTDSGDNNASNVDATADSNADESAAAAPQMQGATNGTIGAQGSDATVIQGVNTAGTVRVNNLANLEALLNIVANLGELGALISGLGLIVHGFMSKAILRLGEDVELGPGGRVVLGGILVVLGLALPGVINWFVASARDANLFS